MAPRTFLAVLIATTVLSTAGHAESVGKVEGPGLKIGPATPSNKLPDPRTVLTPRPSPLVPFSKAGPSTLQRPSPLGTGPLRAGVPQLSCAVCSYRPPALVAPPRIGR